jgi:hypothetical protein
MRKTKPVYKQTSFDTAVRNPERYKDILYVLKDFEGKILNDHNLLLIVKSLYTEGLVNSSELDRNASEAKFIEQIIKINSTRKADGGFPAGYCSRFWTYVRTLCELGFVYAQYNKEFKLSYFAKLLINKEIDEQEAFSIQAIKYNRKSPYRNVTNDFNFFTFILKILLKLREKGKALSYEQFIVATFNKDGNVDDFLKLIEATIFKDEEFVYDYLSKNYEKVNNFQTTIKDYPDVVRRLFIISGFISIKYQGIRLIQINENKLEYIKELLSINFSLTEEAKKNPELHFIELLKKDIEFFAVINKYRRTDEINPEIYRNKLEELIISHGITEEILIKLIENIGSKSNIIEEFREIPAPLKLEFFISLLIVLKYKTQFKIKPNYKADHLGKPYSHAPGNIGDIEVFSDEVYWLIEVTLIRNKIQQLNNETTSCIRHLSSNEQFKSYNAKYLSFLAPFIHEDTRNYYDSQIIMQKISNIKDLFINCYSISEFVEITTKGNNIENMREYSIELINKIKKEL